MIDFFVEGVPYAKQSFRYTRSGRNYQTDNIKNWQALIALKAKITWHKEPISHNGLVARLDFYVSRNIADLDNLSKAVLDGMQGIIYKNDKQIFSLIATKTITKETVTGVRVRIGDWNGNLQQLSTDGLTRRTDSP